MALDPVTLGILGGTALLNLFGANKASNASKDASAMQVQAAREAAQLQAQAQREALGFQREVYNQGRADQQPWIQAGQGSVNKLAHLMGIDMGGGGFSPLQASSAGASSGRNYLPNYSGTDSREAGQNAVFTGRRATPRGTWPGTMPDGQDGGGHPWSATDGREFGSHEWRGPIAGAPKGAVRRRGQPAAPQTVTMQAPDGTVQAVPSEMVEHYTSLGAKVVS